MKRKTTITLTIAGLLGLAGVLYGATFFSPVVGPFGQGPVGVAASRTELFATDFCIGLLNPDHRNIQTVNCDGTFSVLTSIPSFVGSTCEEMYMAIAPSQSANAVPPFTPRDVFITNGLLIYRFTPPNPPNPLTAADIFAVIPSADCAGDHTGITFDHTGPPGTFGNEMIVTCKEGNHSVWRVNGVGTPTHIADVTGAAEIEGPAVVPTGFGTLGGQIWVSDEQGTCGGIPGAVNAI